MFSQLFPCKNMILGLYRKLTYCILMSLEVDACHPSYARCVCLLSFVPPNVTGGGCSVQNEALTSQPAANEWSFLNGLSFVD